MEYLAAALTAEEGKQEATLESDTRKQEAVEGS